MLGETLPIEFLRRTVQKTDDDHAYSSSADALRELRSTSRVSVILKTDYAFHLTL